MLRDWIRFLWRAVAPVIIIAAACQAAHATERPNVLLILTDDQGYGDLHAHGNDKIDTPVLDRLAAESVRFDRFVVSPLCTPTRAAIMTGRYPRRVGAVGVTRGLETLPGDEVTIAEVLKAAGYATGCFGKWHLGEHYPNHPTGQGFDEFFGFAHGHWDEYFDPQLEHNGQMVQTRGFITDVLADRAMQFIARHRKQPFFCFVPFNAPHTPHQLPDRYFDKYRARGLDTLASSVYGLVENVDENIGRILARLDELDLANRTVVIFLSDNGPEGPEGSRYNAGLRGMKGTVYEGGERVPMFVRWPGRLKPRVVHTLAAHIDLLPTIAELCGVTNPATKPLDGRSLVPLMTGDGADWPDRMIFSVAASWRWVVDCRGSEVPPMPSYPGAVRTQRWRAVNEGRGWQLFDIERDPGQATDQAAAHPDVVASLGAAYEAWMADVSRTPLIRPRIQVGHRQRPAVEMASNEAYFSGRIDWYNRFCLAHDSLTGWTDPSDKIWWEIDVVTPGRYSVALRYACAAESVGTRLRVGAGEASVEAAISAPHHPEPRMRPTRHPKKRFIQTFATLPIGEIQLHRGPTRLVLEALSRPGDRICDVQSVILRRID